MSCPPTTIFSVPGDEMCQFLHGISCIHYSLLLKLENVCSLPCLQMMAPLRPLRTITQMSLLNLLLNLLRKCHYSNHYSSLLKGHFHYSSLLSHYALGTLLMRYNKSIPCRAIVWRRGADPGSRSSCRGAGVVGQISPHPTRRRRRRQQKQEPNNQNNQNNHQIDDHKIIKIIIK